MIENQINLWKSRVEQALNKGKPYKIIDSNIIPIVTASKNLGSEIFYRGESQDYKETALMPSVFRGCNEKAEYYDALTNFPKEFEGLSNLSKLAKMQHYNYHTRLLDLTENPLVALWFACSDYSRNEICNNKKSNGCFYVIATKKDNVLSCDSDRALLLSCLSRLSDDEKINLYEILEWAQSDPGCYNGFEYRISEEWIKGVVDSGNSNLAQVFRKYIAEAARERSAFAHFYTRVEDLFSTFIVRPKIENDRQRRQAGLFAIFGIQDKKCNNSEDYVIKKYIVPASKKRLIIDHLDKLGINEATLFGDMESRAHYFQMKNH